MSGGWIKKSSELHLLSFLHDSAESDKGSLLDQPITCYWLNMALVLVKLLLVIC